MKAKRAIIFDKSGRSVGDMPSMAIIAAAVREASLPVMRSDQSKNAA
jgi:hypothetical protein